MKTDDWIILACLLLLLMAGNRRTAGPWPGDPSFVGPVLGSVPDDEITNVEMQLTEPGFEDFEVLPYDTYYGSDFGLQ